MNGDDLAAYFRQLRVKRERSKSDRRTKRPRLGTRDRQRILAKTGAKCHICGGQIDGRWQADHVLAHSAGGGNHPDNFLAAHSLCNNYRWDYTAEEFQYILKLGVWLRTQIEKRSKVGRLAGERFAAYERARVRRKTGNNSRTSY